MDKPFEIPGMKEMLDQISDLQKKNYESFKQTVTGMMGQGNPMAMFEKNIGADNPLASAMSETVDMMRNAAQGMIDITEMIMPGMNDEATNDPQAFFQKHLPGLPTRIMKKILEIPPVGLTRPHQEKINLTLDKMGMFHSAAMDFLYSTMLPVEEATLMTFREMGKKAETLKSPEDMQKVYELWIKSLEKEYQEMFKTDRYKRVVARVFNSMAEMRSAYRELFLDMLQIAGLPFGKEVDELCKDMFAMKRKMKEFETKLNRMTETSEL
jgi:hypothetical protein